MNRVAVTYHGRARSALERRYPFADLDDYLCWLDECRAKKTYQRKTHKHHVAPRAQFPELVDDPDNLIKLTVEQHVHAHDLLSMAIPDLYVTPSFIRANMHIASVAARIGGRAAAAVNKRKGTSVYSREIQLKGASAGGKVTGPLRLEVLARYRTREHQRKAAQIGNHKRYHVRRGRVSPKCGLCAEQEKSARPKSSA
jgi:hypothetical protein